MRFFRSFLSLILVLVTTLLVSCSSAPKAKIPTIYTPEKIAQLEEYRTPIASAREKMDTLKDLIQAENWVDTRTFIHGPFGELRQDMAIVNRKLLPKDQPTSRNLARELFGHFERIDAAAKERNGAIARDEYVKALEDFDAYLDLVPSSNS